MKSLFVWCRKEKNGSRTLTFATIWRHGECAGTCVEVIIVRHHPCILFCAVIYRIAGNFRGRKLSQIGEKYDFHGENFRGLLAFAALKVPHPQILRRKLSRIATKLRNSRKFSPSKVSHYTVLSCLGSLVGLLGSYICNVWSRIRKWRKDWSHSSCEWARGGHGGGPIWASLSEPHTSKLNGDFVCIYLVYVVGFFL